MDTQVKRKQCETQRARGAAQRRAPTRRAARCATLAHTQHAPPRCVRSRARANSHQRRDAAHSALRRFSSRSRLAAQLRRPGTRSRLGAVRRTTAAAATHAACSAGRHCSCAGSEGRASSGCHARDECGCGSRRCALSHRRRRAARDQLGDRGTGRHGNRQQRGVLGASQPGVACARLVRRVRCGCPVTAADAFALRRRATPRWRRTLSTRTTRPSGPAPAARRAAAKATRRGCRCRSARSAPWRRCRCCTTRT